MAIRKNISDLINQRTVEQNQIEYKEGDNFEKIMKTMCAYANDIDDFHTSYIIIGINENNGLPVLPPKGLGVNQIDNMQKEIVELAGKISPNIVSQLDIIVEEFLGKNIIIIEVTGGYNKPYRARKSLSTNKSSPKLVYVRLGSVNKVASREVERDLMSISGRITFDDRPNRRAELSDIKYSLIQEYLSAIGSNLVEQSEDMTHVELLKSMKLTDGPNDSLFPKNLGLLFFNEDPAKFFRAAKIDIVEFSDEAGSVINEISFKGPINRQITDSLTYIQNNIIKKTTRKIPGQAEAAVIFNYPFEALREAIVNAFYHQSYEDQQSIEVRIYSSYIEITSHPAPYPL